MDVPFDPAQLEDASGSPPEDNMEDEYDDTAVIASFTFAAFTSCASSIANFPEYLVVDFACSVNLTPFISDFSDFHPSSRHSTVGDIGVFVMDCGIVRLWHSYVLNCLWPDRVSESLCIVHACYVL
jgi:hypothetical protein